MIELMIELMRELMRELILFYSQHRNFIIKTSL